MPDRDEDVLEVDVDWIVDVDDEDTPALSRATRWAVAGSRAATCMGGIAIGSLGLRGSVDDSVWVNGR